MTERENIGKLMKNLTPLHDLEYKVVFNLHENVFFQKLISREVLEKVRIKPTDYFKALMFLDYFSNVISNDYTICANLENLSKAIRDQERAKEKAAGLADKYDEGLSYLSLETAVLEAGLFAQEKHLTSNKQILSKQEMTQIEKRYKKEFKIDLDAKEARSLEPFYEALGEMVCSQISDKSRPYLAKVSRRNELGAIAFSDYVLSLVADKSCETQVYTKFGSNDYLSGSIIALKQLMKEATLDKLKSSLGKND